jgi:transcriptional regulator with XRE-family HTH domain
MSQVYRIKRHFTELGGALKKGREAAGLTQRDVSDELKYSSAQFISNFERGISAPPLKKLKFLSKRYRLPVGKVTRLLLVGQEKRIMEALHS